MSKSRKQSRSPGVHLTSTFLSTFNENASVFNTMQEGVRTMSLGRRVIEDMPSLVFNEDGSTKNLSIENLSDNYMSLSINENEPTWELANRVTENFPDNTTPNLIEYDTSSEENKSPSKTATKSVPQDYSASSLILNATHSREFTNHARPNRERIQEFQEKFDDGFSRRRYQRLALKMDKKTMTTDDLKKESLTLMSRKAKSKGTSKSLNSSGSSRKATFLRALRSSGSPRKATSLRSSGSPWKVTHLRSSGLPKKATSLRSSGSPRKATSLRSSGSPWKVTPLRSSGLPRKATSPRASRSSLSSMKTKSPRASRSYGSPRKATPPRASRSSLSPMKSIFPRASRSSGSPKKATSLRASRSSGSPMKATSPRASRISLSSMKTNSPRASRSSGSHRKATPPRASRSTLSPLKSIFPRASRSSGSPIKATSLRASRSSGSPMKATSLRASRSSGSPMKATSLRASRSSGSPMKATSLRASRSSGSPMKATSLRASSSSGSHRNATSTRASKSSGSPRKAFRSLRSPMITSSPRASKSFSSPDSPNIPTSPSVSKPYRRSSDSSSDETYSKESKTLRSSDLPKKIQVASELQKIKLHPSQIFGSPRIIVSLRKLDSKDLASTSENNLLHAKRALRFLSPKPSVENSSERPSKLTKSTVFNEELFNARSIADILDDKNDQNSRTFNQNTFGNATLPLVGYKIPKNMRHSKSLGSSHLRSKYKNDNTLKSWLTKDKDSNVSGAKDSNVFGAKDSNVSGAKDSNVSGAKDSNVSGAKDSNVSGAKDSNVSGAKDSNVSGAKDSNVSGAKDSNVSGAKDSNVSGAKDSNDSGAKDSNVSHLQAAVNSSDSEIDDSPDIPQASRPKLKNLRKKKRTKDEIKEKTLIRLKKSLSKIGQAYFLQYSDGLKYSKDVLNVVGDSFEEYMHQVIDDLSVYARHAGRNVIEKDDFVLLLKRQGFINKAWGFEDLCLEYLPSAFTNAILPCYYPGDHDNT